MPPRNDRPWEPQEGSPGRRQAFRPLRRVLILCEDEKSSKFYLDSFPVDRRRIDIQTVGTGRNTDSLVEKAKEMKAAAQLRHEPYNEVFCVFDRDSFPAANFNRALQLARNADIHAIWVNEAFELWYLLHFDLITTAIPRTQYQAMLDQRLGLPYLKNDNEIYQHLVARQPVALKFADQLRRHWLETRAGGCNAEQCNPSTNVQELVQFLNGLAKLGSAD